jgi:hypothetical protein
MVDVYGVFILVIVFLSSLAFYRNSILKVFLTTKTLQTKDKNKKKEDVGADNLPNPNITRNLGLPTKIVRYLGSLSSPVFRSLFRKFK